MKKTAFELGKTSKEADHSEWYMNKASDSQRKLCAMCNTKYNRYLMYLQGQSSRKIVIV